MAFSNRAWKYWKKFAPQGQMIWALSRYVSCFKNTKRFLNAGPNWPADGWAGAAFRNNVYDFFDIKPEQLKRIKFNMFDVMLLSNRGVRVIDIQSNWVYLQ